MGKIRFAVKKILIANDINIAINPLELCKPLNRVAVGLGS
jgi:hypothetical protein